MNRPLSHVFRRTIIPLVSLLLIVFLFTQADASKKKSSKDSNPIVYVTRTGHKYHRDGCRYLRQSKIKITLKDAKEQGYTPCSICDPPQINEDDE
jgi:hypothetical protein